MEEGKKYKKLLTAMNDLRHSGLHCILVNTELEAKNFIMYHIGVGTSVCLDDSEEVKGLKLDKSIVEKGGTLLSFASSDKVIRTGGKNLIDVVEVCGKEFWKRLNCDERSVDRNFKKKIIVVFNVKSENEEKMIEKMQKNIQYNESIMKNYIDDISLIIINKE